MRRRMKIHWYCCYLYLVMMNLLRMMIYLSMKKTFLKILKRSKKVRMMMIMMSLLNKIY